MNAFQSAFSLIQNTIEFKPEFNNGTGYLDGLAALDGLFTPYENLMADTNSQKNIYKTITTNGRKVIVVATRHGNVVLFERYNDNPAVIANHMSDEVKNFLCISTTHPLTSEQVCKIVGLYVSADKAYLENQNLSEFIEKYNYNKAKEKGRIKAAETLEQLKLSDPEYLDRYVKREVATAIDELHVVLGNL
jgi:hypothetical protein